MKKIYNSLFYVALMMFFVQTHAQVGVNTQSPQATLDVSLPSSYTNGSKAGITVPLLTGDQIEAISTTNLKSGTLVYSTSSSTSSTPDVNSVGYWFWKDATNKWEPITTNAPKFFYSPSIPVPTDVSSGSIDLYNNYKNQFATPLVKSPSAASSIPFYSSSQLSYYITWYDTNVFRNVAVTDTGILTYEVIAAPSRPTYMNVIFVVK